jgi:Right handed beta helix region
MMISHLRRYGLVFLMVSSFTASATEVKTVTQLLDAVAQGTEGAAIEISAGTFQLSQPLVLKAGMTLKGAGIGKTILTHTPEWKANPATLPDPETDAKKFDRSGYLIDLAQSASKVTVTGLTLTGPQLHGAIFGYDNAEPHLHDLRLEHFLYCGIRTYKMSLAKIHDCTFLDVGMRWHKGEPGVKGGIHGGGIFCIWTADSEIWNNRFLTTGKAPHEHYFGIKGRQGKRCRIHHNTIEVDFSIEFPFESDEDMEIDHNICHGAISIPRHKGGPVPASGRTFHIHHNVFKNSYSIEFVRNGVEIDHNLFDFDVAADHGNLISAFGKIPAPGPASFHHNLVSNPGRGIMWMNEPFGQLDVHHNHIIARTTKTPRMDGLFGFDKTCDFKTFRFTDNIIECLGSPRPLFRNDASASATIENNQLTNISDTARYANPMTGKPAGLVEPLHFRCGVNDELSVDGWKTVMQDLNKNPDPLGK